MNMSHLMHFQYIGTFTIKVIKTSKVMSSNRFGPMATPPVIHSNYLILLLRYSHCIYCSKIRQLRYCFILHLHLTLPTMGRFFSLRFNGHFPREPGLAGVYWRSKGWWSWWWQLDHSCKAPVKSSPPTNQYPVFYRLDALPVAQPTVSKHWREKYHIPIT